MILEMIIYAYSWRFVLFELLVSWGKDCVVCLVEHLVESHALQNLGEFHSSNLLYRLCDVLQVQFCTEL